jgi:hypothetical protein
MTEGLHLGSPYPFSVARINRAEPGRRPPLLSVLEVEAEGGLGLPRDLTNRYAHRFYI